MTLPQILDKYQNKLYGPIPSGCERVFNELSNYFDEGDKFCVLFEETDGSTVICKKHDEITLKPTDTPLIFSVIKSNKSDGYIDFFPAPKVGINVNDFPWIIDEHNVIKLIEGSEA